MPGITGIIAKSGHERHRTDLDNMIESMAHEDFYVTGTYFNRDMGVYVGWTAHPGSFSDCMPLVDSETGTVLIFCGETFASEEDQKSLSDAKGPFDFNNAGYLLQLYKQNPESFFLRLNGWFAGVLIEPEKKRTILFNDRYAMGRLYLSENNETLVFSSEAKALLRARPKLRHINVHSLAEFFSHGCVLGQDTLFEGIYRLEGGSLFSFSRGKPEKKVRYFVPKTWENQPKLDERQFLERFSERVKESIPRYLDPSRAVALSLTGGWDTRMILACSTQRTSPLPCYTFAGSSGETQDVRLAQKLARICSNPHQILRIGRDFFSDFDQIAKKTIYVTDGTFGICGSHEIYLNRLARQVSPVRVTGNFGSEILRGVTTLKPSPPQCGILDPDFEALVSEAGKKLVGIDGDHPQTFAAFKEVPWHLFGSVCAANSQLTLRTPYMDNQLVKLAYSGPGSPKFLSRSMSQVIRSQNPVLLSLPTDRGEKGAGSSRLTSFQALLPSLSFKIEYRFNEGMAHWLSKLTSNSLGSWLEGVFLGRHKFLFYRRWFRNELSPYLKAVFSERRTLARKYVRGNMLEKIVDCHIAGTHNYTREINQALTAELIHRLFLD